MAVARRYFKRLPLIASALGAKRVAACWYDEFFGITASVFGSDLVDVVGYEKVKSEAFMGLDFLRQPKLSYEQQHLQRFCKFGSRNVPKLCRSACKERYVMKKTIYLETKIKTTFTKIKESIFMFCMWRVSTMGCKLTGFDVRL